MAKTFRFTDIEEKALIDMALRINRDLVKMGKMPLRDTEIIHEIIRQTLIDGSIEISRDGKIIIEPKKLKSD